MDWNAFGALATAAGVLVAIIPLILQWRREAPATASQNRSEPPVVLRELSSIELQLLRHVHPLSAQLAALEMRFPLNSPMNTPDGNGAKCDLVRQLHETELVFV
jgi:hypothetical protein